MKKRILVTVLSVVMIGTMLSGCALKAIPDSAVSVASENKTEDEPVKFTIFMKVTAPEYPADGGEAKTKILEGFAKHGAENVDYEVIMAYGAEYDTKLTAMAASGTLPDFFQVTPEIAALLQDQGLLLDSTDYLKNSPSIMASIKQSDLDILADEDGRVYMWPEGAYDPENCLINTGVNRCMVFRADWAEKLGINANPKTLDELYMMLKAFRENDPDGDGQKDTYGMTAHKDLSMGAFPIVWGAYEITPQGFYLRDGKLVQGSVLPEAKEVMGVLQKWYAEGLIDPEFLVTSTNGVTEKFNAGSVGMVETNYMALDEKDNFSKNFFKVNPEGRLDCILPVESTPGIGGKWPVASTAYTRMKAVSANCKDPERLFKMLDWTADISEDGGFYYLSYGEEGKDYIYDKENNSIISLITPESPSLHSRGLANPVQWNKMVDRRWLSPDVAKKGSEIAVKGFSSDFEKRLPVMDDYPELPTLFEKYFAKIITGELPLDAYDDYVKEYMEQGGQEIEDAVNAEYQTMKK